MGIPRVMRWRNNGPCRCEHEVFPIATIYCFVWVCLLQSTIVLSIATNIINPSLIDTWWMNIPKTIQMNHDETSNSFWDKWCHPKVWSFPKPENVHFNRTARWNAEKISASTPNLQRVLQPQSWNLECKRPWITYNPYPYQAAFTLWLSGTKNSLDGKYRIRYICTYDIYQEWLDSQININNYTFYIILQL